MKHVISIMILFNSDVQADMQMEKISAIKTGFGWSHIHISGTYSIYLVVLKKVRISS